MQDLTWIQMIVTIICSVFASSGFWAYLMKKSEKKSSTTKLMIGIAHDRILYLGMKYIDRGYITNDEYQDLITYLYEPYTELGGDGMCKKVMEEINELPLKKKPEVTSK